VDPTVQISLTDLRYVLLSYTSLCCKVWVDLAVHISVTDIRYVLQGVGGSRSPDLCNRSPLCVA
jgi:hypothetical protein